LNSSTWRDYCTSGKKAANIPAAPDAVYAEAGWVDWGDWLGTGRHVGNWQPFKKARAFVRRLGLKSGTAWREYCKSGKKPKDIPACPSDVYAKDWAGMIDWLGTGKVAPGQHCSFKKARAFVHQLGLKSGTAWREYCKSGKKPKDIPAYPSDVYARKGWDGIDDWLGTGRRRGNWRRFTGARAFVRRLGLKSGAAWREYYKSGKKPKDIPVNPEITYAKAGWKNWGDWLGTGRVGPGQHRPFKEARDFVRRLGLKSGTEWRDYCKSGKKPAAIPVAPNYVYRNRGWAGMADWLGYAR
jgi:hypothetical protein